MDKFDLLMFIVGSLGGSILMGAILWDLYEELLK